MCMNIHHSVLLDCRCNVTSRSSDPAAVPSLPARMPFPPQWNPLEPQKEQPPHSLSCSGQVF